MWPWIKSHIYETPDIESVRKYARILVIDDLAFPQQKIFERDGYHIERWPEIKSLSQLTDGHYHLILLDIQGVGLRESPETQGLGILEHIKSSNPSQAVIVYSATPQSVSSTRTLVLADAVLDKSNDYVVYKSEVDRILLSRATPASFIAAMNKQLGENAILAPKAVAKAAKAFRRGDVKELGKYLQANLPDAKQIDTILGIIGIGIKIVAALNAK